MYIVSIIFGLIIVISSIFMIRIELNRVILKREQLLVHSNVYKEEDLFALLENLQSSIDEMNSAFYEIASDLEGKYSQHEKEIQLLEEKLNDIIETQKNLSKRNIGNSIEIHEKISDIKAHAEKMEQIKERALNESIMTQKVQDDALIEMKELTLREKVIKLRSEGVPLKTIAKELDMGMGELQLLIQLPDTTKKT